MYHRKAIRCALSTTAVVVLTMLAACDSSVAPELPAAHRDEAPVKGPALVDGRLVFLDTDHITGYLAPLIDGEPAELAKTEQQTAGFQSLRAYVDGGEWAEESSSINPENEEPTRNEAKALDADGVTREDFPISDAFLSVLSSRGQVQVGDSVYMLTRDYTYRVHVNDIALLDESVPSLSSPAPAESDDRIKIESVETAEAPPMNSQEQSTLKTRTCTPEVGNYRMRGASYITNLGYYAEAGVNTAWQKRKRVWFVSYWSNTSQSGTLSHKWTAYLRQGHILLPLTVVYNDSDSQGPVIDDQIHRTLAWGFNHRIRGWIETDHSVVNSILNTTCHTDVRV